jgi:hypothetical protein
MTPKAGTLEKDNTLVRIFDIHNNYSPYSTNDLWSLDFAIKNLSNYPIKNIKLFFVYKNFNGEVVSYSAKEVKYTILPQLALQFNQPHNVKYFKKYERGWVEGIVEIRILDYQIDRAGKTSPADILFK